MINNIVSFLSQLGFKIWKLAKFLFNTGPYSRKIAKRIAKSKLPFRIIVSLLVLGYPKKQSNRFQKVRRKEILFDLDLDQDLQQFIYLDIYEDLLIDLTINQLKPGSVFIDVGANIGYWSLLAARQGADVIAFDPSRKMIDQINSQAKTNNMKIDARMVGLSDKPGKAKLFLANNKDSEGQASLHHNTWDAGESREITLNTLDEELKNLKI